MKWWYGTHETIVFIGVSIVVLILRKFRLIIDCTLNDWIYVHNLGPKGCENAMPISICKSISFVCGVKCLSTSKGRGRLLIRLGNSDTLGPLANAYLIIEMRQVRQFSNLSIIL